jgi:quercetin 2,3-dioxygenase
MKAAGYHDIGPDEIPAVDLSGAGRAKVMAGVLALEGARIAGPIQGLTTTRRDS